MNALLTAAGAVLVVATLLPWSRHPAWWVRVFDFPRLQIAVGLAAVLLAHAMLVPSTPVAWAVRALIGAALAVQAVRMWPYSRVARRQVQDSRREPPDGGLRLLFANVLQTNRCADRLLDLVRRADPDVFLALETDDWWAEALDELAGAYPHVVRQPQDNTYGMLLFSRLPLLEPQVRFLIEDDVPSIHADLLLEGGRRVRLHALHPRPPALSEADSSVPRDAELVLVGRQAKAHPGPVVVLGDMNDVAWSHTSALFRRISGLLDPRIGRGLFNTFHADHRWMRWPLDHVFHSNHFRLVSFRRLEPFGSDHFPVFVHLDLDPPAAAAQPEPEADAEDHAEAVDKVAEAAAARAGGQSVSG